MKTFNDGRARELVDWLEWDQNNDQAQAHNGRFGTNGLLLLSQLDPTSDKWDKASETFWSIAPGERQRFIDAAKVALDPSNKLLLDQVHGGDGVFEWNDIPNWLSKQPDGVIGGFSQGNEGDCWLLAGVDALNQDKDGKQILANAVTLNKDGTYTVNFKSNAYQPVTITREDIDAGPHSDGDADLMMIETAMRKEKGNIYGGQPGTLLGALTGQRNAEGFQFFEPGQLTREKLQQIVDNDKDGITMTFSGPLNNNKPDKDFHAWSVRGIDLENNTISYINPWDSDNWHTMSLDEFLRNKSITYLEVAPPK